MTSLIKVTQPARACRDELKKRCTPSDKWEDDQDAVVFNLSVPHLPRDSDSLGWLRNDGRRRSRGSRTQPGVLNLMNSRFGRFVEGYKAPRAQATGPPESTRIGGLRGGRA